VETWASLFCLLAFAKSVLAMQQVPLNITGIKSYSVTLNRHWKIML